MWGNRRAGAVAVALGLTVAALPGLALARPAVTFTSYWSPMPVNTAVHGFAGGFVGVSVVNATTAWAVGGKQVARWDGHLWRQALGDQGYDYSGVYAAAGNDVWTYGHDGGSGHGFISHF